MLGRIFDVTGQASLSNLSSVPRGSSVCQWRRVCGSVKAAENKEALSCLSRGPRTALSPQMFEILRQAYFGIDLGGFASSIFIYFATNLPLRFE